LRLRSLSGEGFFHRKSCSSFAFFDFQKLAHRKPLIGSIVISQVLALVIASVGSIAISAVLVFFIAKRFGEQVLTQRVKS
jgi:hypothetical protein